MNEKEIELLKEIKDLLKDVNKGWISNSDLCEHMYDLSEKYSDLIKEE